VEKIDGVEAQGAWGEQKMNKAAFCGLAAFPSIA
jgi:hypothetical protein